MLKLFVLMSVVMSTAAGHAFADDWAAFRGTRGDGISLEPDFPTEWSPEKNIRWRTPLAAPDNGSPIAVKGKVFLLSATDEGKQRSVIALDRATGQELWKQTVAYPKVEETHKTSPHGATTPVSDGERVVVWHRSAGMHCYDLDGKPLWSRDLGEFHHIWGGGSSPIIHGDRVIQLCGPGERTFVVALNKQTGEIVWQTPIEPGGSSSAQGKYIGTWSTPSIIQVDGQDQLLVPLHTRVVAYDPDTGQELWDIKGLSGERGDLVYTSAVVSDGTGVILGGFSGPALGFILGGSGDMTAKHRLWHDTSRHPQRIGTGVIIDGYLYSANADGPGSIDCIDIKTGAQQWVERRTSEGPHWGSIVFAGGHLYVTGQNGVTRVFEPNPSKHVVIAENDLGEPSNSTPAFSDGEIFLRTFEAIYAIAEKP